MKRLKQTQEVPAGHIIHDDHSHEVINISKAEKWSCSHHRGTFDFPTIFTIFTKIAFLKIFLKHHVQIGNS